jgi:hypothetical protein
VYVGDPEDPEDHQTLALPPWTRCERRAPELKPHRPADSAQPNQWDGSNHTCTAVAAVSRGCVVVLGSLVLKKERGLLAPDFLIISRLTHDGSRQTRSHEESRTRTASLSLSLSLPPCLANACWRLENGFGTTSTSTSTSTRRTNHNHIRVVQHTSLPAHRPARPSHLFIIQATPRTTTTSEKGEARSEELRAPYHHHHSPLQHCASQNVGSSICIIVHSQRQQQAASTQQARSQWF